MKYFEELNVYRINILLLLLCSILEEHLSNYDDLITKSLSEQFINLIFHNNEKNDNLENDLLYLISNIIQIDKIHDILAIYKVKCVNEIVGITRTVVQASLKPNSNLSREESLKKLPYKDFHSLLSLLFDNLYKYFDIISNVHNVIYGLLSTIEHTEEEKKEDINGSGIDGNNNGNNNATRKNKKSNHITMSVNDKEKLETLSNKIMTTIWTESQKHLTFLLNIKCQDSTDITLEQLKYIWKECWIFITKSENYFNSKGKLLMNSLIAIVYT